METEVTARSIEIAKRNDEFRKGYSFTITRGVQELPDVLGVVEEVRRFKAFTEDNDPYNEHDFGSFEWGCEKIFWKIDYYDPSLKGWCDPLDDKCTRLLTIMLAEEY